MENYRNEKGAVNPEHYKAKNGMEVIDVIKAYTEGLEGIEAADTANVIKYICRWKKKNGLEDLKKARWYINNLIEYVEGKESCGMSDPAEDVKTYLDDVYFDTRAEACDVLMEMIDIADRYGFVTMSDLGTICGFDWSDSYKCSKYGWSYKDITKSMISHSRDGFFIIFGRVTPVCGLKNKSSKITYNGYYNSHKNKTPGYTADEAVKDLANAATAIFIANMLTDNDEKEND